jgi:leader peptidase (prepilin peptidase) / N-methyltransferase
MNIINILANSKPLLILAMTFIGFAVGSFLNVVIYRLPIMLKAEFRRDCLEFLGNKAEEPKKTFNLLSPASHCLSCGQPVKFWHNIPLLSFILLRGKCPACKEKISWRYPIVELVCAIATLLVTAKFGWSSQTFYAVPFVWGLIVLTFIDISEQLLPDELTLGLVWLGLLANAFYVFASPLSAILGAMVGYLCLWSVAKLFKLLRHKEGLGYGDFKLFAAFGAFFGIKLLPLILIVSSTLGGIVGITLVLTGRQKIDKPIPFGPYLAIAAFIILLYGDSMLRL